MRVVFIYHRSYGSWFPPRGSDAWYLAGHTAEIARYLKLRFPDLKLENWRPDLSVSAHTQRTVGGIKCRVFPAVRVPFLGDLSPQLLHELDSASCSTERVVVHYGGIAKGQFLYTVTRFHRKLRIIGNHQGDRLAGVNKRRVRSRMRSTLEARVFPKVSHFLCAGQTALNYLASLPIDRDRLSFPELGVDMKLFRPMNQQAARTAVGLELEGPLLLYVGRADVSKGLPDLLEQMPTIARRIGARLVCVGVFPVDPLYSSIQQLGATCFGHVSHEMLAQFHNACDVMVRPGGINSGPLSVGINVVEALSCGIPVVSGTLPELPDYGVIGSTVGEVPGNDLAEAVLRGIQRRHDAIADRRDAVRPYSWDTWLDNLVRIYDH
jgi:glycosyltransferase involved in cell wall biosynthesis